METSGEFVDEDFIFLCVIVNNVQGVCSLRLLVVYIHVNSFLLCFPVISWLVFS